MNRLFYGFMVFGILFLNSCIVSKKVVYVKDMVPDSIYQALEAPPLYVQKGDRLSIIVSAKTPELAAPFNTEGGTYTITEKGDVSASMNRTFERGYLVDQDGHIEFPILGTLNVLDLSLEEVKELVRNRLVNKKLINEPIVKVELLNLKINVMGEINSVGVIDVPDGRITLLDVISRAGGLTTNGQPNQIAVIRQKDGERKIIINDLESKEVFNSPTYYLQQNDIVYAMPKNGRLSPREEQGLRYTTLGLSVLAVILTALNLLKN